MSFTSLTFLVFVAVLVPVYYLIPRRFQWMLLLAASLVFYLCGGWKSLFFLLFTTASTYGAGLALGALRQREQALPPQERKRRQTALRRRRQLVVLAALLANFGMLYVLKYWSFTAEMLTRTTGVPIPAPELLVPLGVSFFIFQSAGYVIDVYRGKYAPQRNFARYALFVSFFPQMVQGPISRYQELAPELLDGHRLDWDQLKYGIQLAMWGYFKKLVVAQRVTTLVSTVFDGGGDVAGSMVAVAALAYCVELYCDFSGGIDITRGVAQMLGISMTENFRRPLFATSLTDYWRRWHISLGAWMRDYLFYSLALSRPFRALGSAARRHLRGPAGKILATSLATFVVYFVIGIWHGANFRYIAFGFYNGILITASLLLEPSMVRLRRRIPLRWEGGGWRLVRMLRTGLIVFVGRYITRSPRLMTAVALLGQTVTRFSPGRLLDGTLWTLGITPGDAVIVVLSVLLILVVEGYQEKGGHARRWLEQRHGFVQWLVLFVGLVGILLLGPLSQGYVPTAFIYAQF